jgi:2-desacetyl-2-hydroxyethyl bacteriochlorophyllide A dehydrogenase
MKAAVFVDTRKIEYYEDYPKPILGKDDILVKVHYCGICGSDITNFKLKMYQVPLIMGHEFTGEVYEIGADVDEFKIGDLVCGINVSLDISQGNLDGLGIFQNGGFAEFVKVPRKYLFHIPGNISTKEAVMIESFANASRGVRLSKIQENQKIFIIGGGNIGLCFLNFLIKEKNPKYIVIIEPHEYLRQKAIDIGATDAFPPTITKIKKFIKNHSKPSFIFDCAGNEKTILMAIDLIDRGGTIILEGVYKGKASIPLFLLNSKEATIKGVLGHDRQDILNSIALFEQSKIDTKHFITQEVHLNEIQTAFNRYVNSKKRDFVKIVVKI